MNLGRLIIDIAANTAELKTGLNDARRDLGAFKGNVEGMLGSVTKLGTGLLKGLGIGLTIGELARQTKITVEAFADAERQGLRLNAVLRATGNTAGISAEELKKMAEGLSRSSLFDDKAILATISQLETFDNISGDTFRQAIKLSVDLASLWDGDLTGAAFALGKALQSPADAASLLGKAKVRLTEDEKKAIEQFVRMNDVADAQKVILKALEDRVGGVAGEEASGLAGAFHRLGVKIEDARKRLVAFFYSAGQGTGLAGVIQQAFTNGAGLGPTPSPPIAKLPEMQVFTSTEMLSKEIGELTTLAGARTGTSPWSEIRRITSADISRLREIGRAHAEALRLPNLELETRVRLARELKAIQDALDSLHGGGKRTSGFNLAAPRDLSRMGASPEDEAAIRAALNDPTRNGLSTAMIGVGGQRGSSPLRDQQTQQAAALWRETWVNVIRETQEAFSEFFMSIGEEGFKLAKLIENIARMIQRTLAEIASQQVVRAIFGGVLGNITGPGGQTVGGVAGNQTQSMGNAQMSPVMVHQNITFAPSFIDGPSGAAWLQSQSGTVAGIVADAATSAPAFARHIVAQGSR
jgi:hypothetical protein